MTSELLSKIISKPTNLSPSPTNKNRINTNPINKNPENIVQKPHLNVNADKFFPLKEKQKMKNPQFFPFPNAANENITSIISPSFMHYINPQRLLPYDKMLKKNIRTFNLLPNINVDDEKKLEHSLKEKYNLNAPIIEINFKFTCDYEVIESEIKEFLELFGEIESISYDLNSNSIKISYKYYFSAMYANYHLNHLLYENRSNENESIVNKENNGNKNEKVEKNKSYSDEKQNEDIVKFIKFLTDNYKNEPKNKNHDNFNEVKSNEEKGKNYIYDMLLGEDNNNQNKDASKNMDMNIKSLSQNVCTSEKKYNSNNNSSKFLFLQQNSETPIKKTNTINNYSADLPNSNKNKNNNNSDIKQPSPFHSYAPQIRPLNNNFRTPLLYVPFVPKMNMNMSISIPVLFPLNSPFLNKSFYFNKNSNNNNNNIKSNSNTNINLNKNKNEKMGNKINSCLVNNSNDNPINVNEKVTNENTQTHNDTHIKDILDNLNNKIAIFSNNSNNSTNSNEKNAKIENSNKSKSETGSNNNILSNKSDSTIKTEEVNKSSNTDENKNYANNQRNNNNFDANDNNANSNGNSSSDKNISLNMDFMSSSKGKALSLERLNNFLQDNKPVSNFSNPILSLNNSEQKNIPPKIDENAKINNNPNNKDTNNNLPPQSKNNMYPMNNYFNSMYNFLFISNYIPNQNIPAQQKFLKLNNANFKKYDLKPNPIDFNKNVIDFNKLTLETKNKVHFMTHSSRNYYYKYVCNYTVQIENDNIFMVTKRIIGKNGCFLKKILQESCIKYGDYSTKIRLRGKGSGYIDKVSNTENDDEPLTLSISSLNYPTYYNCCLLVDNLMKKIYDDYYEYLHKILPKELHYSIIKKKLIKNEFIVDRVNSMPWEYSNKNIEKNDKMDENKDNIAYNNKK